MNMNLSPSKCVTLTISALRRRWFLFRVAVGLFAVGGTVGFYFSSVLTELDISFLGIQATGNPSVSLSFWYLLQTNLTVAALLIAGCVLLGATTLGILFMNGLVGGIVLGAPSELSWIELFVLFIPHSVPEFMGFWLAGAAGLTIPSCMLQYLLGRTEQAVPRKAVLDTVVLAAASSCLIVIGAVIESAITTSLFDLL